MKTLKEFDKAEAKKYYDENHSTGQSIEWRFVRGTNRNCYVLFHNDREVAKKKSREGEFSYLPKWNVVEATAYFKRLGFKTFP